MLGNLRIDIPDPIKLDPQALQLLAGAIDLELVENLELREYYGDLLDCEEMGA